MRRQTSSVILRIWQNPGRVNGCFVLISSLCSFKRPSVTYKVLLHRSCVCHFSLKLFLVKFFLFSYFFCVAPFSYAHSLAQPSSRVQQRLPKQRNYPLSRYFNHMKIFFCIVNEQQNCKFLYHFLYKFGRDASCILATVLRCRA